MRSLKRTVFQLLSAVGFTHASSVIPVVRCSEALSATLTRLFVPLNESALPYLPRPAPAQLVFVSVPLLPVPDWSAVEVPLPSSKP